MRLWKFSISSLSAAVPAGLLISILATEKKMLILSLFTSSESGKNIAYPPLPAATCHWLRFARKVKPWHGNRQGVIDRFTYF